MNKFYLPLLLALASLLGVTSARAQVITDFGAAGLNPVDTATDFYTPWSSTLATQNGSTLTFNGEPVFGGGSLYTNLTTNVTIGDTNLSTLKIQLTGENTLVTNNPNDTLEFTLYETNGNYQVFDFTLGSFGGTGNLATENGVYNPGQSSGGITSPVDAFVLTADGGQTDTIGFQFDQLSAVPEPSTYAMLGFGVLALFGWQRSRKPKVS
jgi:hypothetical protein